MDPESLTSRYKICIFQAVLASLLLFFTPVICYQGHNKKDICITTTRPASHPPVVVHNTTKKRLLAAYKKERLYSFYAKRTQTLFNNIIFQAAESYHVDPALIKAIIMVESSYNPRATSSKGAMGLMQLMPDTARAMGVDDGFNPENNIKAGVKYFKKLLVQFDNDIRLALAAYNAGSRTVKEYQDVPPFKTTRYYVDKVMAYYDQYKEVLSSESNNV